MGGKVRHSMESGGAQCPAPTIDLVPQTQKGWCAHSTLPYGHCFGQLQKEEMRIGNHELIQNFMIQDKRVPSWNITCNIGGAGLEEVQRPPAGKGEAVELLLLLRELRASSLVVHMCTWTETRERAAIGPPGIQRHRWPGRELTSPGGKQVPRCFYLGEDKTGKWGAQLWLEQRGPSQQGANVSSEAV